MPSQTPTNRHCNIFPRKHFLTPNPCFSSGTPADVLSFSETRAQSLVNHKAEQFLAFNQRQLSRIYPSAYRIDSSNFNPQFYWNVGCQLGKMAVILVWRQRACLRMKTTGVFPLATYLSLHINWLCIPHVCTNKYKFYLWPTDHMWTVSQSISSHFAMTCTPPPLP